MRRILAMVAAITALALAPSGEAPSTPFAVAQLRYAGGEWNPRPAGLKPLLNFLAARTSLEADVKPIAVDPAAKELFDYPFVLWAGNQEFPPLSNAAIENLQRYLNFGGFLLIDDNQASPGYGFDVSIHRELKRIFPTQALKPLAKDHTIFRSFFLLTGSDGRVSAAPMEGLQVNGRTVVVVSHNDLLGAWSRDSFGNWELEVKPGGEEQRKKAFRLGTNIIMYALCDDYKKDALHVDYILKRRKVLP